MDFDKICRICLESDQKEKYDIYTNIYPSKDDGLPKLICKDCTRQLKRAYTFNIQCEESDKKLRSHLSHKQIINGWKEVTGDCSIKVEDFNEKIINGDVVSGLQNTVKPVEDLIKSDDGIKLEPEYKIEDEDSCWDADDDNLLLKEIKSKRESIDDLNGDDQPKKKKGKRKRNADNETITDERHVPESKLPHQCEVCGKFLSTKSNLKAHKICHSDLRPYKCDKCPSAFRGHSTLNQHKKLHTGETPYHCEYCPKKFSRRTGLVNHIRMHTGEKLYSCDICFKSFVQSAQLSIHMKRHKGDKPYLCQDCGKGFPIKADLKVHQRIHNGEKPYSCHMCEKTFATSGNLSIHVRIHNKEVRYKCKECQRGFVTCSAYNVHLKRHKGQRDYHCECGKTFYTSSALKQHKVVHTGEKNYKCKICDRKFSQSSHLGRHFKRDHAKQIPVPSSNYYKLIVMPETNKPTFDVFNQQMAPNESVKCEGS
ncbi:Zinc finger protein 726 [Papilio xuthus]|uniref:Zinc finger protein 726 n=1 Tax=Papilio xuthus TaxID=66420 RepID=A0A0N1IMU3_PAPXU|nr:Zinc finger protein 726 [Papilio xuthus]